jgi:uncharacterized protein YbjT (DUF2867 family)
MRVLVTGGTGVLGRELVQRLKGAGHTVRVMSRRARQPGERPEVEWAQADVETGQGLAEVVSDVEVIVNALTRPAKRTWQVDVDGTRRLLEHAKQAGVVHFVYISIVGIERVAHPYYRSKLAGEAVVMEAGVPWSILRATQFHTLLDGLLQPLARLPIALLPTDFQFQPIDPGEVAARLVECVASRPGDRLPDIGGPEVMRLGDMARVWLEARGLRRFILHVPLPVSYAKGYRNGYNTCPEHKYGRITWAEWVQRKYRPSA